MSRKTEQRAKVARRQREDDLRWLVANAQGRRVVAGLLAEGAYGQNVFTGNSQGAFLQGKQAIANGLAAEIKLVALEQFHAMEVELRSARDSDALAARQAEEDTD